MTLRVPWRVRGPVRRARNALALARLTARQGARWREIAATPPRRGELAVSYGVERMPGPDDVVYGGAVKFALLAEELPNAPRDFNVLYLGSTSMPLEARMLVRLARRRGAAFVWNQNGVAYRGWHGDGWELENAPRARLLHEADHVVFQSAFCKLASDHFYGAREDRFEILHNPVDTRRFTPEPAPARPLTLLLAGNQYQRYRVGRALEALAEVRRAVPDARLAITGAISFSPDAPAELAALVRALGLDEAVELTGPYTQRQAPAVLRRGDVLLHTKYNDPCPTVVLEAMACGLPVVYSASGGTPELVGDDAGIGIPAPLDWEQDHPPTGAELAAAVQALSERLSERREAARARAALFDSRAWIERHRSLFVELVR
jgi:glycosyltransferase involved in cell wall biosynthesis